MKKKILVVDDEPLVRRSLKRILEGSYTVYEAEDGLKGLNLWKEHQPDLVILDVLMPGLSGPQVLMEISQEERKKAKVVLISAYSGEYDLDKAKTLGFDLFIPKPFDDVFRIRAVLEKLLEQ